MKTYISILLATIYTTCYAQENENDSIITKQTIDNLDEVVLTGTMKPVSRKDSSIPIEVYSSKYFKTSSFFDKTLIILKSVEYLEYKSDEITLLS